MVNGADGKIHRIGEKGIKDAKYHFCYQGKAPAVNNSTNSNVHVPISPTRI